MLDGAEAEPRNTRLHLSLLMCCHKAATSSLRGRPTERVERCDQQWVRTLYCVAAGESLQPGDKLSWQSVTRLFSPVCLSVCQIRGPGCMGVSGCPLSGAEGLSLPISLHSDFLALTGLSLPPSLNTSRWFLCDADEDCKWLHSTHEMLSGRSESPIDWPSFAARLWLVNWSPVPCWHSDPNGGELLLSRHALTSLLHPLLSSTLTRSQA